MSGEAWGQICIAKGGEACYDKTEIEQQSAPWRTVHWNAKKKKKDATGAEALHKYAE